MPSTIARFLKRLDLSFAKASWFHLVRDRWTPTWQDLKHLSESIIEIEVGGASLSASLDFLHEFRDVFSKNVIQCFHVVIGTEQKSRFF